MAPRPVDDPRYRTLTLRVSIEEKEWLDDAHRRKGLTLSQYMRLRLFGNTEGRAGR